MLALGLGALYAVLEQKGSRRLFPKILWGVLALLVIQNFILVEWVRTRRTKSSSGGAYSAATWIRWAKGPEWLARTLEQTGYPFLQPASTVYALSLIHILVFQPVFSQKSRQAFSSASWVQP